MIRCKELVPDVYTESEDFLCVLRLLDLVSNVERNRNGFNRMRDPFLCPEEYLPLLAKYVGYEYDDTIPANDNRIIIEAYPFLTRNKGSKFGIELAIKTALVLSDTYTGARGSKASYVFRIDNVNRNINIQIMCVKYSKKLLDLVNYVRPIGFSLTVAISTHTGISGSSVSASSKITYVTQLHNTLGTSDEHAPIIIGDTYYPTENDNDLFVTYKIGINVVEDGKTVTSIDRILTKFVVTNVTPEGCDESFEFGDDVVIENVGGEWKTKYAESGDVYILQPSVATPTQEVNTPYIIELKIPYNATSNTIKSVFGGIVEYTLSDGNKYVSPIQKTVYPSN